MEEHSLAHIYEDLENQKRKYSKLQILFETLEESLNKTSSLDNDSKSIIRSILAQGKLDYSQISLLGINNDNQLQLDHEETFNLKRLLEQQLSEKYSNLCAVFESVTNTKVEVIRKPTNVFHMKDGLSESEQHVSKLRKTLQTKRQQYQKYLLEEYGILNGLSKLRLHEVPVNAQGKFQALTVHSNMNALRAAILQEKNRIDIFAEDSDTLTAYKIFLEDLEKQRNQLRTDIEELESSKEKYKALTGRQFHDLIKTFVQYKSALEKKKLMFQYLKN